MITWFQCKIFDTIYVHPARVVRAKCTAALESQRDADLFLVSAEHLVEVTNLFKSRRPLFNGKSDVENCIWFAKKNFDLHFV